MSCFVSDAANVLIADEIDVTLIILDHQHILAKQNMIGSRDGIGDILGYINYERFKWDGMEQLLNLISHGKTLAEIGFSGKSKSAVTVMWSVLAYLNQKSFS